MLMMQAWARSLIDFAQLSNVVFGTCAVPEMHELGPDGRPCKTFTNKDRWNHPVIEDMSSVCDIELVDLILPFCFQAKINTHTFGGQLLGI